MLSWYINVSSSHSKSVLKLSWIYTQLRVHCAEVLGTPIVGDYKYGWQAHKRWKELHPSDPNILSNERNFTEQPAPFDLDLETGNISQKQPRLHLHCKEMVLPDVSQALQESQPSSDFDLSKLKSLRLVAPLPLHMQRSWDILNSWVIYISIKILYFLILFYVDSCG